MVQLDWESGVVIATLVGGIGIMSFDWVGGLLTVVVLYVVAEGVSQTGGMEKAMNYVLGKTKSAFWAQVRIYIPVMIASAFLNNTPIVALLIPMLIAWGRRAGVSPKKLLIPLSYAAVFGGTLTLIGTSTSLVIASLQEKRYIKTDPANARFNFFDITPYGVPYALFGMCYSLIFSKWLLPGGETRRYSDLKFTARVFSTSAAVGRSLLDAGFVHMERFFLVAVERAGSTTFAPGDDYVLQPDDILHFEGDYKQAQLYSDVLGFELLTSESENVDADLGGKAIDPDFMEKAAPPAVPHKRVLVQAAVKPKSELVGQSIRSLGFRSRFDAAVLAVKRNSERQLGRIGDIVLEAGDVLVLLSEKKDLIKSKDIKSNFKQIDLLDQTLEKEFMTALRVTKAFSAVGKSITQAGLRGIEGLYLVGIDRENGEELRIVSPDTTIEENDLLWFVGSIENMLFLSKIGGLESTQSSQISKMKTDLLYRHVVQVSVAYQSPLIGKTIVEADFRENFDAVVTAIHRSGSRVPIDVRKVRLQAGDVILLNASVDFAQRYSNHKAFSVIAGIKDSSPQKKRAMWIAVFLASAMIITQIVGGALNEDLINLFTAATITAGLMTMTRCLNADQARSSIDWTVYVCIAFAFAMSTALEVTNVAQGIADIFTRVSRSLGGKSASFCAIYAATALLSEIVSNNAAGALMYPIAARLGDSLGVDPTQMSAVVMLGASAGFTFPWSYQCNLMVYAAGNYRFLEFAQFGAPCQLWLFGSTIIIFVLHDNIWLPIVLASALTAGVLGGPILWLYLPVTFKHRIVSLFSRRKARASPALLEPINKPGGGGAV